MIRAAILGTLLSLVYVPPEPTTPPTIPYVYETADEYDSLGDYYITAYCGCGTCCGEWATKRAGSIVSGASGEELKADYSVAADEAIPFGTRLYIDGKEYVVHDRGGKIKGNRLDVYFETHEEALAFNAGTYEVKISMD